MCIRDRHTNGPHIEDTKLQLNENLKPPIKIVEELIKQIGTVTANYHRRKKMAAEADKRNIKDQIKEQRAAIDMNPMDDPVGETNIAFLEEALMQMEQNISSQEVKLVRNKAQFKATKVKDKLARPPPKKNTISEIITESQNADGSVTQTKHKGQLNAQAAISNFYSALYAHNPCDDTLEDIEEFLKDIKHETVSDLENESLTNEITETEVHNFIKTLKPSKAPGTSGLNSGYFLEIWPYAGSLITRSINDCLESGTLPDKQKEGVIVLIPKQDKDQRIIGNLRPITLLNCYYKIISGIITNRMKPVLQKIIGNHQKAYLPGRYIRECTRTVYDIMHYAIKNDIPLSLIHI